MQAMLSGGLLISWSNAQMEMSRGKSKDSC